MTEQIIKKINHLIGEYLKELYSESEFHNRLETITVLITESELIELREAINKAEAELERIDFLVNKENQREQYIIVIIELQAFLNDYPNIS